MIKRSPSTISCDGMGLSSVATATSNKVCSGGGHCLFCPSQFNVNEYLSNGHIYIPVRETKNPTVVSGGLQVTEWNVVGQ